jgi:Ala-tRNA(Pro) deacylase
MNILKKVIDYLEKNKYKYGVIEHKKTYTAWDKAQTEKIKPQLVAKALAVKLDSDYVLALIPANRLLDKPKFLKLINSLRKKNKEKVYKKIDLAKEVWMKKNLLGKVGATPPFGSLLKVSVYIDSLLTKNKKIYLGSGDYMSSILVNTSQYLKIENPIRGIFSKKK